MNRRNARQLSRLLAKRLAFVPSWAWQTLEFEITEEELRADLDYGRDEVEAEAEAVAVITRAVANDNRKR